MSVLGDLFGGGGPQSAPSPGVIPESPEVDARQLASQRALLNAARRGRDALVIDPSIQTGGVGSGVSSPTRVIL